MAISAPAQNLFEADYGTGSINEFTPSGMESTFASGLTDPGPIAFDSTGDLFVAELGNDIGNIIEITPGGIQSTFATLPENAQGLVFNKGDLFVADHLSSITEITLGGVPSTYATGPTGAPSNLAVDSAGNLFVTTQLESSIFKVAPDGTVSVFTTGTLGTRGVMAFNSEGDLFLNQDDNIYEYANNSGSLSTTPVVVASSSEGGVVRAMTFDNAGDLLETDAGTGDIYEFVNAGGTLSSTPVVFASGLNEPTGLAFDPVPEPSILSLLAVSSCLLLAGRRRVLSWPKCG